MRYTVEDHSDPKYPERCYNVIDTTQDGVDLGGGRYFSKAEAQIIEFALNAVAEGMTLVAGIPYSLDEKSTRQYDGPTEGVAP